MDVAADAAPPCRVWIGHRRHPFPQFHYACNPSNRSIPSPCGVQEYVTIFRTAFTGTVLHATGVTLLRISSKTLRDQRRPARLVACAKAGPRLAMEILVEEQAVPAIRSRGGTLFVTLVGTAVLFARQEEPDKPRGQLLCHLAKIHPSARAGRTLHLAACRRRNRDSAPEPR